VLAQILGGFAGIPLELSIVANSTCFCRILATALDDEQIAGSHNERSSRRGLLEGFRPCRIFDLDELTANRKTDLPWLPLQIQWFFAQFTLSGQSEILRCAQNDRACSFFRSLLRSTRGLDPARGDQ
jgi:hypothetical protein